MRGKRISIDFSIFNSQLSIFNWETLFPCAKLLIFDGIGKERELFFDRKGVRRGVCLTFKRFM